MRKGKVKIVIRGDKRGKLSCDPWISEAGGGDTIVWISPFPFAIHFHEKSPLNWLSKAAGMPEIKPENPDKGDFKRFPEDGFKLEGQVIYDPAGRGSRKFHYYVSCFNGRSVEIFDPDLVIPPRRG